MKFLLRPAILIFLIAGILAFFIINLTHFDAKIKNFVFGASSSTENKSWSLGGEVSDFFGAIFEKRDLKEENENLSQKNKELEGKIAALEGLKKDNETLRQALGINLEKDFVFSYGKIVGKDISRDSLLVDKGAENGISTGMPVVTSQKFLVGSIGRVYDNFSEIILITNKESSFDAKIPGKEIYGIIKGKGGFNVNFELIPRDSSVSKDDTVVSAALGRKFPQGIFVGQIKDVLSSDTAQFQTALIDVGFSIRQLDQVFIITNFGS